MSNTEQKMYSFKKSPEEASEWNHRLDFLIQDEDTNRAEGDFVKVGDVYFVHNCEVHKASDFAQDLDDIQNGLEERLFDEYPVDDPSDCVYMRQGLTTEAFEKELENLINQYFDCNALNVLSVEQKEITGSDLKGLYH